jgi:hypothetical protein
VYFYTSFEPVEMHTPATKKFQAGLRNVGLTTEPTYGDYAGYMSVALLVEGLRAAGSHASPAAIIAALGSVKGSMPLAWRATTRSTWTTVSPVPLAMGVACT